MGRRPGRLARAQPLEEVAGLDPERPRECEQPLEADLAGAFLVPVDLLVGGPDPLGELPLGQAERAPPLAQPGRDVAVGVLRAKPAAPVGARPRVVPRHLGSRRFRSRREPRERRACPTAFRRGRTSVSPGGGSRTAPPSPRPWPPRPISWHFVPRRTGCFARVRGGANRAS